MNHILGFGGGSSVSSSYGAPQQPSQSYGGPVAQPSQSYGGPVPQPSQSYGGPSGGSGGRYDTIPMEIEM